MSPKLHIVFGPQGAGKSTYARALARSEPAVHFAIDDWMARLFSADAPDPLQFAWMMERVQRCEAQIWSTAAAVLSAGGSAVLDLGLMRRADRARAAENARSLDLPVQFHFITAAQAIRRARVQARNEVRGETFAIEVTPQMFEFMEGVYEPPKAEDLAGCVTLQTD